MATSGYTFRCAWSDAPAPVVSLRASPCGGLLAYGASDGSVCLRNPLASLRAGDGSLAASSADATHIKAHSSGVTDISWSPDGAYFVTGSDDMSVRTWATATATEVGSAFKGHTSFVSCVHVSPRCNLIASGSFDESIRLWDVRTGACLRVIPCHSEPVTSVQFSYDGTMLASTSYDGLMSAAKFSPNNRYLLVSTLDGRIRLWDYLTSRSVKTFTGHTNTKYACTSAFSITSTRPVCVSGSDNGTVHVWDVSSRDMVAALNAAAPSTTSGSPVPPSPVPDTMEVDVPGTVMQGSAADEPVLCVDAHPTEDVIFASYQGSVQAWAGPAFCPPFPA